MKSFGWPIYIIIYIFKCLKVWKNKRIFNRVVWFLSNFIHSHLKRSLRRHKRSSHNMANLLTSIFMQEYLRLRKLLFYDEKRQWKEGSALLIECCVYRVSTGRGKKRNRWKARYRKGGKLEDNENLEKYN